MEKTIRYSSENMFKPEAFIKIKLTKGQVSIIDNKFYDLVNGFEWVAKNIKSGGFYARSVGSKFRMHRVIMSEYIGSELNPLDAVYHKNGNALDNRIDNLTLNPKECDSYKKMMKEKKDKKAAKKMAKKIPAG